MSRPTPDKNLNRHDDPLKLRNPPPSLPVPTIRGQSFSYLQAKQFKQRRAHLALAPLPLKPVALRSIHQRSGFLRGKARI